MKSSPIDSSRESVIALNEFKLNLIKSQWQLKCFIQVLFYTEHTFTFSFKDIFDIEKLYRYMYVVSLHSWNHQTPKEYVKSQVTIEPQSGVFSNTIFQYK